MKIPRALRSPFLVILALASIGCRSGPVEGWSRRARTMTLTSGPTEIVISSSRVPGYWARESLIEQEFFLYTKVRSFEKGSLVRVEGPFGGAYAAVFREESGLYQRDYPLPVLVVWKMEKTENEPRP